MMQGTVLCVNRHPCYITYNHNISHLKTFVNGIEKAVGDGALAPAQTFRKIYNYT